MELNRNLLNLNNRNFVSIEKFRLEEIRLEDEVFLLENILHFVLEFIEYQKYEKFLIAVCAL
jgi:hypothetical protein